MLFLYNADDEVLAALFQRENGSNKRAMGNGKTTYLAAGESEDKLCHAKGRK